MITKTRNAKNLDGHSSQNQEQNMNGSRGGTETDVVKVCSGHCPMVAGKPSSGWWLYTERRPAARLMKQNKCRRNSVRNTECNRRNLCAHHSGEGGKVNCGNNSSPEGSEFLAGTVFLVSWWTDKGNLLCKCTVSIVVLRPFLESCWKYCLLPFVPLQTEI